MTEPAHPVRIVDLSAAVRDLRAHQESAQGRVVRIRRLADYHAAHDRPKAAAALRECADEEVELAAFLLRFREALVL